MEIAKYVLQCYVYKIAVVERHVYVNLILLF